jgi:hypothetical protein
MRGAMNIAPFEDKVRVCVCVCVCACVCVCVCACCYHPYTY